jgi:ABC-type sulfate transport system substrate-binding protein
LFTVFLGTASSRADEKAVELLNVSYDPTRELWKEINQKFAAVYENFYRPSNEEILKKHADTFPEVKLFEITEIAKDFNDAHKKFIGEGGVFDSIYKP